MIDFQALAFDVSRCYVHDQIGVLGEDTSKKILGWIRSRDITRLSACSDLLPAVYHSRDVCRVARQIAAFFKKNAAFAQPEICRAAAQEAFEKAELLCRQTNKRLDHYLCNEDRLTPDLRQDIGRAQDVISDVLSDYESFMETIPHRIRITAGASSTSSRRNSLPYLKLGMRGTITTTRRCKPYVMALARHFGVPRTQFRTVCTNRVETVPKNYKTDRTIACEPTGNLSLQLAFDSFVKERLKKFGVNLSSQLRNQEMAREASIDGSYATIDLAMASDTISLNTVTALLPLDWGKFLADIRTPLGRGFSKTYKYAKFSSMGNGATFGLETLIFFALCRSVTKKKIAIYGDDLVVPVEALPRLYNLLRFFGFQVNQDKSFTEGPFRESCGADWFNGIDVTPFYLRSQNSMKIELCHVVNGLARLTYPGSKLAELLRHYVEQQHLPFVPWNDSTISGIWLYATYAYRSEVIQTRHHIPRFKAFVPKSESRPVRDSRTLFLWHLDAARREEGIAEPRRATSPYHYGEACEGSDIQRSLQCTCIERTLVPVFTHKYRRKWVCWHPPVEATPDHLIWWSEFVLRSNAESNVGA